MGKIVLISVVLLSFGCQVNSGKEGNTNLILFNSGVQSSATLFSDDISDDINISSGNLGGLSGADNTCQNSIPAGVNHGSARAFISVNGTTLEIRDMPSNWSIPTNLPIQSVTGVTLAQSWQNLLDNSIDSTLAAAGVVTNNANWWSGSTGTGTGATVCSNWTSASGVATGAIGSPSATDSTWMGGATSTCDAVTNNLLCLAFTSTSVPQIITLFDGGAIATGNLGGRSGADATCVAARPANVVQSSIRAFFSVSASDQLVDMTTNYGISNVLNIRGPTGTTIASNWADLFDSAIDATLFNAGILPTSTRWASGSNADGTVHTNTCVGWTSSAAGSGATGRSDDTDSNWITGTTLNCATPTARLMCVAY